MKKINLILILCSVLAWSCGKKTEKNEKLASIFEEYYQESLKLFPLEATSQGDSRYNDLLPNHISEDFRKQLMAFYVKYNQLLDEINETELSSEEKIYYNTLRFKLNTGIEHLSFPTHYIPFSQFDGLPLTIAQLGSGESFQPFKTVQDYDNWLKRIKHFVVWADTAIVNFDLGIKNTWVLPKALVLKMIPQMQELSTGAVEESIFYGPIKKLPASFSAEEKARLTESYKKAISEEILPTYQKLAVYLEKVYLPASRPSSGIINLKNGKKYYDLLIYDWTTTLKTPDEIFQKGLSEVRRIRKEMEKVKEQVGFSGSLNAFFEEVKKDPKLMPFQNAEEVLAAFGAIQAKIEPQLPAMFSLNPKTKFEIRRTEAFREATASAEYMPGSTDGSRPGVFYVPIPDAKKFNLTSGMESLFLHEAIPGHHYQFSLQQENTQLPNFMRFAWFGAYGEGWALYTESLGKELGLYTDPYQYLGALGDEMHRAIRLVVDVGLHAKGWSREEALKYMLDNEAISEQGAVAEIERYMAMPGQALSYKIGSLKIRELRSKYEKALGNKFVLADFHTEVLKNGCLPLNILEEATDAWAESVAGDKK